MLSGVNGWMFDIDFVEPPTFLGTNLSVIPGSGPGVVWFARRRGTTSDYLWVSPVDVESLTVGERIDITDLFSRPIVGVADGLVVVPVDEENYGRFAYWSPTDGLAPIRLSDPHIDDKVVAASGNLVVVASIVQSVSVLDIVSGEYVGSFELPGVRRPVTSACVSPDGQHVIVVGFNGQAVVGNTTTGEVISLNEVTVWLYGPGMTIQLEHRTGWTTDDQLGFIAGNEDAKHIVGFDIATDQSFHVATLDGPKDSAWWLTASGTMC